MVVPATAQFVYRCHDLDKAEILARLLQAESRGRVMIFCTTKRAAQRVADDLADRGFEAAAIHGDLGQVARERALERFRGGKVDVLVATDVAARGLDVEGVTHVVNHTCPDDDKTYVHRIGRTGRAGASGIAVTFVDWQDIARWKVINATLGLPFEEPVETYSTSEHLHHDLGIPRDATGRIGEPRPERRPAASDRDRRPSGRGDRRRRGGGASEESRTDQRRRHGGDETPHEDRGDRPAGRGRRRRRLRAGVVVADQAPDETGDGPLATESDRAPAPQDGSSARPLEAEDAHDGTTGGDTDGTDDSAARPPRRRRSRTRRRSKGDTAPDAAATDGPPAH